MWENRLKFQKHFVNSRFSIMSLSRTVSYSHSPLKTLWSVSYCIVDIILKISLKPVFLKYHHHPCQDLPRIVYFIFSFIISHLCRRERLLQLSLIWEICVFLSNILPPYQNRFRCSYVVYEKALKNVDCVYASILKLFNQSVHKLEIDCWYNNGLLIEI